MTEMRAPRVLVMDDDPDVGEMFRDFLEAAGLTPTWSFDPLAAIGQAGAGEFDAILLDIMMPGMDGITFLRQVKEVQPDVEVVMLTARSDVTLIKRALELQAFDYLVKPAALQKVLATMRNALTRRVQNLETDPSEAPVGSLEHDYLVAGPASARLVARVRRLARHYASAVIRGPRGSGKRHLARLLHAYSGRPEDRYIEMPLEQMVPAAARIALLGNQSRSGVSPIGEMGGLKRADGGTLVLAGVEKLPPSLQSMFVHLLDSGQILEAPYVDEDFLDLKIVGTTSVDLAARAAAGEMLEDFVRHLSVIDIEIPALGSRLDEVLPLARHFLAVAGTQRGRPFAGFSMAAEKVLLEFNWPGDVGQLRQAVLAAASAAASDEVVPADLPEDLREFGKDMSYKAVEDFLKS